MLAIVIWGLTAIASCLLAGVIAAVKNRDHSFWMGWCFLIPPMLIPLLLMPRNTGPRPRRPSLEELDRAEGL